MFTWSPSTSSTTLQSIKSLSPSTSSFGRTLLEHLTRSHLYRSLNSLDRTKLWSRFYVDSEENIQKVLDAVSVDQKVITNPRYNRNRRTVILTRQDGQPFGFTLQTYYLKRKGDEVPRKVTYVDYVHLDSPAADAGVRPGDVIISINGRVVTEMTHTALIELIASCREMRMIVIFEKIREKIDLAARAIRLRKLLNDKLYQLNLIDMEEQKILNRAYARSLAARNSSRSLVGSLSSTGASSESSVSSTQSSSQPSDAVISSDGEHCIIRIPSVMSNGSSIIQKSSLRHPLKRSPLVLEEEELEDIDCISLSSIDCKNVSHCNELTRSVGSPVRADRSDMFDSIALSHVIRVDDSDDSTRVVKF